MASSTTSGNLTVYEHEEGDAVAKLRAPAMALHGIGHEQTGVGRTQCMPLSAGIAQEPVPMTSRLMAEA